MERKIWNFRSLRFTKNPSIHLEEVWEPLKFNWNKCKLETVSFGHGITTTPLQAAAVYAALANGGKKVKPSLLVSDIKENHEKLISGDNSKKINKILRKVVNEDNGTAHLADVHGYYVGGKTGTSQNYKFKDMIKHFYIISQT